MTDTADCVPRSEAVAAVRQLSRMMAALYYHLAGELVAELGEEKAAAIIRRAIAAYGAERGGQHRKKAEAAGFGEQPQDYVKLPDLPAFGWEGENMADGENPTHKRVTYCPFAEYWREKNFDALGRLYCGVDQAKYAAFHPAADLVHLKNVLDGDEYCEMVCRTKESGR